MIPYKTSKDYKRLKELLDEGKGIVCFYENELSNGFTERACDVFFLKGKDLGNMTCTLYTDDNSLFEEKCIEFNIEFIEPNL
jgi:hypothetical protein